MFQASHNELKVLPPEVFQLSSLQCLDISFNYLQSFDGLRSGKVHLRKTPTLRHAFPEKVILSHRISLVETKLKPPPGKSHDAFSHLFNEL